MSSLSRLRALQNICATSGVDGLLFVGGVDGKHHAGSRETLAWLLTGLNGRDIFGDGVNLAARRRKAAATRQQQAAYHQRGFLLIHFHTEHYVLFLTVFCVQEVPSPL